MTRLDDRWPSEDELRQVFVSRYGAEANLGWSPARRWRAGYFSPAEFYEATVARHVFSGCTWLDVGGGHQVFPNHPSLAHQLVARCGALVAVDPDATVHDNIFATERHQCRIEAFRSDRRFDLATFRMVVEHVEDPAGAVRSLRDLVRPGGRVIVFTVNRWSPLSIVSRITPFWLHHPVKRVFWGGDERDTFPVRYRMNTRKTLRAVFGTHGFAEEAFTYLDDLSTFGQFKRLGDLELAIWSNLRRLGIGYPENCLLGIYRRSVE